MNLAQEVISKYLRELSKSLPMSVHNLQFSNTLLLVSKMTATSESVTRTMNLYDPDETRFSYPPHDFHKANLHH